MEFSGGILRQHHRGPCVHIVMVSYMCLCVCAGAVLLGLLTWTNLAFYGFSAYSFFRLLVFCSVISSSFRFLHFLVLLTFVDFLFVGCWRWSFRLFLFLCQILCSCWCCCCCCNIESLSFLFSHLCSYSTGSSQTLQKVYICTQTATYMWGKYLYLLYVCLHFVNAVKTFHFALE